MYICTDDSYTPQPAAFDSLGEFLTYCDEVFGATPIVRQLMTGDIACVVTGLIILRRVRA